MSAAIVSRYAFRAGHLSLSVWKVETQYKTNGNVCHPNRWFFSSPPLLFFFCQCKNYPRVLGPWIHHHIFSKGFSDIMKGSLILDSRNVLHLKGYIWMGNWCLRELWRWESSSFWSDHLLYINYNFFHKWIESWWGGWGVFAILCWKVIETFAAAIMLIMSSLKQWCLIVCLYLSFCE